MDWREDIGRKSQYQRIPDNEAAGLKSSKVCRVCRVFCMIMIQKSRAVCQRVPSVCQSVSKSAECPQNHTFAKVLPPHQSNLVWRFLRLQLILGAEEQYRKAGNPHADRSEGHAAGAV